LKNYLSSLDKVSKLDVDLVLPGHRRVTKKCRDRIEELKLHHEHRADEVLEILKPGAKNAYQVAMRMSWDIKYDSWEQFPVPQRWFATGEAISHLKYLQEKGMICREMRDGKVFFSLN
jgi:glyoxylase-like metal-dependent hydrolase (beta-lactamase superfamily II)